MEGWKIRVLKKNTKYPRGWGGKSWNFENILSTIHETLYIHSYTKFHVAKLDEICGNFGVPKKH